MATSTKRKADSSPHPEKKQKMAAPVFSEPTKFVTFTIGPEDKTEEFMVHKEVVCFDSPVLAAAFDSGFSEGQTMKYTIEDTTPRAFRLLVQWMYSKRLELIQLRRSHSGGTTPETQDDVNSRGFPQTDEEKSEDVSLAELWILADRLIIPELKHLVINKMFEIFCRYDRIPITTYHFIWKNTSGRSSLRKYILDFCLCYLNEQDIEKFEPHLPRQLIGVMLKEFVRDRDRESRRRPPFKPSINYKDDQDVASVASTEIELIDIEN